ncbi:integrase [Spirillospora sp. NPDC047279]|uniref:integrase n=1 Tax=Spirillospora sp. NPDC047279 TaxID=3155478 RepID=UPI0033E3A00D
MTSPPVGQDPTSAYSRHITTRLLDFTSPSTPWPRRIWDTGTFLALEELHEAGEWVDRRVLHQVAVDWQSRALERIIGDDQALGTKDVRKQLQDVLRTSLTVSSDARRRLEYLIEAARPGYLGRWASHVAAPAPLRPERVARAVASHLLDGGHSLGGLQRWLRDGRLGLSAADLIAEAAALHAQPLTTWKVVVPFRRLPDHERLASHLPNWLPEAEALALLQKARIKTKRAPIVGALTYQVPARDPERAVEVAYELVERLQARARFGAAAGSVVPLDQVIVDGRDRPMALRAPSRGAFVLSLAAERRQYIVGSKVQRLGPESRSPVDDALEIASALNNGPLAAALTGGWAALESMLTEPRDPDEQGRAVAATRAAALVACSWPRAELTALSYQVREVSGDDLSERLAACRTNQERAALIEARLRGPDDLPLRRTWRMSSDIAAIHRMEDVLNEPRKVLGRVRHYVEVSFRRLYRCRNIVLHGGSVGGLALPATLRVSAPLVGAALDRITHAHLVDGVAPLMLAAKADMALQLVGDDLGPELGELIG